MTMWHSFTDWVAQHPNEEHAIGVLAGVATILALGPPLLDVLRAMARAGRARELTWIRRRVPRYNNAPLTVRLDTAFFFGNYLLQLLNHNRLSDSTRDQLVAAIRTLPDVPTYWVAELLPRFLKTGDLFEALSAASSNGTAERKCAIHVGAFYASLQNAMRRTAKGDTEALLQKNVAQFMDTLKTLLPTSSVTAEFVKITTSLLNDASANNLHQQEAAMDRLLPKLLTIIRELGTG
jgi:hypothetical protein